MKADLVILGGGPAGYSAALKAAELGVKPVLIERGRVGGTCLHFGCIPTKTLLAGAEMWRRAQRGEGFGMAAAPRRVELNGLHRRKNAVVNLLAEQLEKQLRARQVAIVAAMGELVRPDLVSVRHNNGSREEIQAGRVVLATGSTPTLLPGVVRVPGRVYTSDELVAEETWPESLLIIGGGVVGVEFASLLSAGGVRVTLIEAQGGLLPEEDAELGRRLGAALAAGGVDVRVNEGLASLSVGNDGVKAVTTTGATVDAKAVLVAVGRGPCLDGVDTKRLGLLLERGAVKVDEAMRTSLSGVFAAGDVSGGPQLAHLAAAQGRVATAVALGAEESVDLATVPRCVYSIPEVAAVGLTEEQVKARRIKYLKGKSVLRGNSRAQSLDETEGFVKVLAEESSGVILGTHAIGYCASELIMEATLAVHLKLTAKQVSRVIHPHPTLAEAFQEACASLK